MRLGVLPLQKKVGGSNRYPHTLSFVNDGYVIIPLKDLNFYSQWVWTKRQGPTNRTYYAIRSEKKGSLKLTHFLHNLIYQSYYGSIPAGYQIDHIDRIGWNNDPQNLRLATRQQQAANRATFRTSTSGYRGVGVTKSGYAATIMFKHNDYHIATFPVVEEAIYAYNYASKLLHLDFAFQNEISSDLIPSNERRSELHSQVEEFLKDRNLL